MFLIEINAMCHSILATGFALPGDPTWAYIGPGTGLSAIGTIVAFVLLVLLFVMGFFWYPLKRLLRTFKSSSERDAPAETEQPDEDSDRARGLP